MSVNKYILHSLAVMSTEIEKLLFFFIFFTELSFNARSRAKKKFPSQFSRQIKQEK